nr:hypothetical protein [Bdellovibrionales bacterium]
MTTVIAFSAWAQAARRLNIQSRYDQYDLVLNSKTSGTIDGKAANLKVLDDLWPVLDNPLGNECPALKGQADVTLKEGGKTRSIYIKQGLVTDGKSCLNVGGEGLLYFPVHREFLIGPKRDGIALKSPLKIFRQGVKMLELKKQGDTWVSDNPDLLLNWDFIERFENTLREFDVRLRVQQDIAAGKTKMLMQSGDQTYEFFKVTGVMWAVKR